MSFQNFPESIQNLPMSFQNFPESIQNFLINYNYNFIKNLKYKTKKWNQNNQTSKGSNINNEKKFLMAAGKQPQILAIHDSTFKYMMTKLESLMKIRNTEESQIACNGLMNK